MTPAGAVIKVLSHPADPLGGVKGQIFKFCNNSRLSIFFTEISHADIGTINMKHIKHDFRSKARDSHSLGGHRGWGQKVKIQLFQNNVMLHIKLKGIMNADTW